jgi:ATP-dependent DNA helicase DinG
MPTLSEIVAAAFAAGGPVDAEMKKLGKAYRPNPQQIAYAKAVANSFENATPGIGEVSLYEAETGVGKSLGYLVPMAVHCARTGQRGLVSTYTINLQTQLMGKDVPVAIAVAKAITGIQISAAVRKGRRNFLSPSRIVALMAAMATDGALTDDARISLEALRSFAEASGDIAEWKETFGPLPCGISEADVCLTAVCSDDDQQRYKDHVVGSHTADIVVTNHALTMISAIRWNRLLAGESDGFDIGVIDEADRIPHAAESVFDTRVSAPMMRRTLTAVSDAGIDTIKAFAALKDWEAWMGATFEKMEHRPGFTRDDRGGHVLLSAPNMADLRKEAVGHAVYLSGLLLEASTRGKKAGVDAGVVAEMRDMVEELRSFANGTLDAKEGEHSAIQCPLLRWSPVRSYPSLSIVPVYPGRLAARLFKPGKSSDGTEYAPFLRSLVFTSATLDAPARSQSESDADFRSFRSEVGIYYDRSNPEKVKNVSPDRCQRFAPEVFGRWSSLHLADRAAPRPTAKVDDEEIVTTNPAWVEYAADGVVAAHAAGGRTLVLTTSYVDTQAIAACVRAAGVDVIEHVRGTKLVDALAKYRETPNALLISPAAWEGVDLPGMVQNLVVTRLPFGSLDNARSGARAAALRARGLSEDAIRAIDFSSVALGAKKRLKQGFGRGIRQASDDVRVWMLDPRFPLPQSITSNRRARAYNDASFAGFSDCIPERFRSGFDDVYGYAEVFPYAVKQEVAA